MCLLDSLPPGEEDMHAYDLSRLQKPVADDLQPAYAPMRQDVAPLTTGGEAKNKLHVDSYTDLFTCHVIRIDCSERFISATL